MPAQADIYPGHQRGAGIQRLWISAFAGMTRFQLGSLWKYVTAMTNGST
jgi:hypothetical protein